MHTSNNRRIWIMVGAVLLSLASSLAFGQAPPPGPVFLFQFRTPGTPQPARFQVVHNRLHFDPGAATPLHQHPGQVVVTVLEGENTFTKNGVQTVYKAGESFVEGPGAVYQARNAGTTRMSVMATYLQPWDAPLSHPEPGDTTPPPRPFTSYQFRTDSEPMTAPFDVVQAMLEYAPGAQTPYHTHPGMVLVTVVDGAVTFNMDGIDHLYTAGESFVELPNQVMQARNTGTVPLRVMATYLLPQGAPLSVPQPGPQTPAAPRTPAALPNTAAADLGALRGWLLLSAALAVSGGVQLHRCGRRSG